MKTLNDLTRRMKEMENEIKANGRELLADAFKEEIFDKHPRIQSVSWVQYTPYFNDGDACTFSVCSDYPSYSYLNEDGELVDVDEYNDYSSDRDKSFDAFGKDARTLLGSIPDSIYLSIFDDHVKVTAYRGGTFSVDEYNHE